jgi:nitrate/TMAO reductase-like tetraheme cytochrome c subunit
MRVAVSILTATFLFLAVMVMAGDEATKETAKKESKEVTKEVTHEYVGVKICKLCHKKDGVYPSWEKTKHAYAYDSLSAEDKKNKEILKYYTTGTTAKGELLTNIQCEACHGPGKDYKKKSVMENKEEAIANGLIIPDENTCKRCHNEKAPKALAALAKDFDFKKMVAKGVHAMPSTEKTETKE